MSTHAATAAPEHSAVEPGILDRIIAETRLTPDDEAYDIAKRGVSAFIEELLKPHNEHEPVKKALVDRMIAEIDAKLSRQVDEILHHRQFQSLESAWRGLKLLVERTDFRENIRLEILNAAKEDLLEDFEDSPEVVQSGLYKHVYTAEYGQFGGQPVGALIANYFFDPSAPDVKTLQYVASVASMAHAPFIAAAGPAFFGLEKI
ncbi:type VI secretion system contractile sheath large subunit, partial [Azotobacter chroococcum]|nr:type VI secretion system contractile sheath large subunit [Azotobacter chroococcum]